MSNNVPTTKEVYAQSVESLQKALELENIMEVPRIQKIIVNSGIGRITKESEKVKEVIDSITRITGQKPLITKAKKSIAGFKIREGQDIGVKVTLRGQRMWDFFGRLVNTALPRVRDFQGVTLTSVDSNGNLNLGLNDHTVFPEIIPEQVRYIFGFQVTVVSSAKNREEGEALFRALGVPLQKLEDKE